MGNDVTFDDNYLYALYDNNMKLAVWDISNGLLSKDDTTTAPDFIINLTAEATAVKSDGTYVNITYNNSHYIELYQVSDIIASSPAPIYATISVGNGNGSFNLPTNTLTYEDKLFVVDNAFNRVHVWNSIDSAKNGNEADTILGQENSTDRNNKKTIDGLFWPRNICFNGLDLWVGEFKFSGRLVKFEAE